MKLEFRQGIISAKLDVFSNLAFMNLNVNGTIDILASDKPVILNFAYKNDGNFLVEIHNDVQHAWATDSTVTSWLYFDINIATGMLTYGSTIWYPVYQASAPINPELDQHWFDTSEMIMKSWNGIYWIEHIRLFAGFKSPHNSIQYLPVGSQVGIVDLINAGYILFDEFSLPIRRFNNLFFTTDTRSIVGFSKSISIVTFDRLQPFFMTATEPILALQLVSISGSNKIQVANIFDINKCAIGMAETDIPSGGAGIVTFRGIVNNTDWSNVTNPPVVKFPESLAGKILYASAGGKFSWYKQNTNKNQIIGTIINETSIYFAINNDGLPGLDAVIPPQPYDVAMFFPGLLQNNTNLCSIPSVRHITFPIGLSGSIVRADFSATVSFCLYIQKNDVTVGTILFLPNNNIATITNNAQITLEPGDILSIVSKTLADITLGNVSIILTGSR